MRAKLLESLLLAVAIALPAQAGERIVAVTSDVAEILVALGKAGEVVGRDRATKLPALAQTPEIGSSRSLSAEPIARLKPTLVVGSALATPDAIWAQLQGLGIRAVKVGERADGQDYATIIRQVGQLAGAKPAADKLAHEWQGAMQPGVPIARRVLISYEGNTMAGRNTPADALIRAAGAINAAGQIEGYKPIDAEALAKLSPDLILVAEHNRAVYGGLDALKRRADIASTPAGRSGRVLEVPVQDFFTINLDSPAAVRKLRGLLN
ncbi:hemin ABC transporter substrate-binding protein [Chitinimonas sp. BJYL2]|uniref:heme/hemin ABC transporter substrate-binding protein n=1 Tax=Chitinimonas sp. BJYL2 TaxID=2976696 RepID=UPI0022B4D532|nr:ABC transporter substrate-binding protein [Chitinimonas sp. BJYL2]